MNSFLERVVLAVVILVLSCACADNAPPELLPQVEPATVAVKIPEPAEPPEPIADLKETAVSGELTITLDYEKQQGAASNQFAVWLEDMEGRYIRTLAVTQWTAKGGYKTRPDSIALWVEKSGLIRMAQSDIDAISSATPKVTGTCVYTWILPDEGIAPGEYKFFVEGTLRWKNYVLYQGVISIGDTPVTVEAEPEYVFEATDRQDALTDASPESAMISRVTADFVPD